MPVKIIRKPPTSKAPAERLKISLLGDHPLDGLSCMFLQVIAFLHEQGFTHGGGGDFYLSLIDRDRHPLTHFPDGTPVAEHIIAIRSPYQCAADEYDRKFRPEPPRSF
jgi:hypothetical protein